MKKILVLLLVVIILTGCTPVKEMQVKEVVNTALNSKYKLYNRVHQGYKFYLPRGLKTVIQDESNVIIKSKYYDYYLYVDLVSYYNKIDLNYTKKDDIYYSELIEDGKKQGIINITKKDNEYIVEISYYYADIAVKVKEKDINESILNCIAIISSIDYHDEVIKSLLEDDILSSTEEKIDVFDTDNNEYQELDVVDDTYTGEEADEYDPDVIN